MRGKLVGLVLVMLLVPGCGGKGNRTIGDLVQHFKAKGLEGKYQPKWASLLGAKEGGGYAGDGFNAELYLFEDEARAESLEKTGANRMTCHRNGRFILLVYTGEEKLLPAFKSF